MLHELSEGDLTKTAILKKQKVKDIYVYLYLRRINNLNILIDKIARLEELKNG